jgi:hypothetical protein
MTLTTRIAIVEPTPVREVFDECRRLIGGERARFREKPGSYHNELSQGLPALLSVTYGVDSPIEPNDEYAADGEGWRDYFPPVDAWSIEVHIDTAYAYSAENGASCSDLHAWFIHELGRWLTERGLTWCWYHEHMGEWHPSSDPVTIMGDPERGRMPGIATPT